MKKPLYFSTDRAKELYEKSVQDPELTKALIQTCVDKGEYDKALIFTENLVPLLPGEYAPLHAKHIICYAKGDTAAAGICLGEAESRFGDDPDYINDRLAYTIEVMGTAAAKKYLEKIGDKPARESRPFLELCARIYHGEGEEENLIKCLYILHKVYASEKARFLLALKSAEHEQYTAALKWFVAVINGYSGSAEYFLSLAGRCAMLRVLERDNWREETRKAAIEIDLASRAHAMNLWLLGISAGLWGLLGEEENARYNNQVIGELEKYARNPAEYLQNRRQRGNP